MNTPDPLHLLDTNVDKYRIVDFAGEGGFSAVYRAEHSLWGEPVAIKFFCHLASADEQAQTPLLEAFMREGKLMSRLSTRSSSIVQARDVGQLTRGDETIPYMVLEWVEGESLEDVLDFEAAQELPARDLVMALEFLAPAGEALAHAHDADIAHRDLKPANFMILPEGGLKVLDFGIAKVMADTDDPGSADTHTQLRSFTPGYGAPEQFTRTHGATGPWTDVFAMALIFVEVLRGGAPVLDGTLYDNAVQSCDARRRPTPRHYGVAVPEAVDHVFRKALAVQPCDRYLHMRDFWLALCVATGVEPPAWTRESGRTDFTISSRPDVVVEPPAPSTDEDREPARIILDEVTLVSNTVPPSPEGTRWSLWLVAALVASSAALVTGFSLHHPAPKTAMSPPRVALAPTTAPSFSSAPESAPRPAPEATSSAATSRQAAPPRPRQAVSSPERTRPEPRPRPVTPHAPGSSRPRTPRPAPVEPAPAEPTAPEAPSPEPEAPSPATPQPDAFDPAGFGPRQ